MMIPKESSRSLLALVAVLAGSACLQPPAPAPAGNSGGSTVQATGGAGGGTRGTTTGGSGGTSAGTGGSPVAGGAGGGSTVRASGGASGGTRDSATGGAGGRSSTSASGGIGGASGGVSGHGGSGGAGTGGTSAGPTVLGDVQFSTPSQTFKGTLQVSMSTSLANAEIRYTVDGSLPTSSSTLYSGSAVSLTSTTQVRAQAFSGGSAQGSVSSAIYIARTIDPTSDLPIMIVEGYGKGKPSDKEVYFDAAVMVWEPVGGVAAMASLPTQAMRAGYHVRGQSSASFPQTPYKIELWDNANQDLDYPLLGMPAESDWALIPPYYDRTLIRNPFTFSLGKAMGMQAPRDAFAEVYINYDGGPISDADYQGIYWVTETIKNNKVRTNLKQLDEDDRDPSKISGGYIVKFDQAAAEEPKLVCTGSDPIPGMGGFGSGGSSGRGGTCWTDLEVVDPDPLNAEQQAWLTDYIQKLHDVLHQSPLGDYTAYIDVPSFIDYLIVSEVTLNVDAYTRSAFYFKDRDQKLKAGPLWDYNFALGGVGAMDAVPKTTRETGWRYSGTRNVNNWYPKLTSDPSFMAQVKTRYQELRKTLLSDTAVKQRMTELSSPLKQAVVRDFAKWPVSSIIKSSTGFLGGPTAATWEGQLEVMQDFLVARLAWIDANLP